MNFDDDDGQQHAIWGGEDAHDQKIGASPSLHATKKKRNRYASSAEVDSICDADVLCGRGKTSFNHPGNKRFRDLITSSIPEYNKSDSRLAKSLVVHRICETIKDSGGRFLKAAGGSGKWQKLDDRACREKVGHAIRDAATTMQTRRNKKKQLDSVFGVANDSRRVRRRSSAGNEMKLDAADPLTFHDLANFCTTMPNSHPAVESLEPRPLLESSILGVRSQPSSRSSSIPQSAPNSNPAEAHQDHHPEEQQFLAHIDQVLGPPASPHNDPLAEILEDT